MTIKNLRAEMSEEDFYTFKEVMHELGAETNDQAIMMLVDIYKANEETDDSI